MPKNDESAIQALQNLRTKSKLNKDRHFAASERKTFYQTWIGLPVILINVFVGTVLVQFPANGDPQAWSIVSATIAAFFAASLSSVQTFFNFSKMAEGHRGVANRYLRLMLQCEHLLLKLVGDQISLGKTWEQMDAIAVEYDQINIEAEAFPTNARDFSRASKRDALVPFKLPTEAADMQRKDVWSKRPDDPQAAKEKGVETV